MKNIELTTSTLRIIGPDLALKILISELVNHNALFLFSYVQDFLTGTRMQLIRYDKYPAEEVESNLSNGLTTLLLQKSQGMEIWGMTLIHPNLEGDNVDFDLVKTPIETVLKFIRDGKTK